MKSRVSHGPSRVAVRLAWLALVIMVVALTGASSRAQQGQGPGPTRQLFEPRGETVADGPDGRVDRTRKRGRRVRINTGALQQADARGGADELTLNLFDDVQLRARRNRWEATRSGGWVWKGRLLDVEGEATFAIQDGVVAGTVFAGDRVFEILFAGADEHQVNEIEPSEFPTDDPQADVASVEPDPQAEAMDAAVAAQMAGDAASQVDVMVIWTPAARAAAGSTSAIQSLIDLSVANTNTAYANSAVTQRLRLVYAGELSYTEAGITTDLGRLSNPGDGFMDSVHALRNTYGADVVTLLGNGYANGGACGVGYLMTSASTGFASSAFNVVDRTCAASNLSYAHELGHNMGLQHDPNNASGSGAYSYAYGYQHPAGAFRTIMAYACPSGACPRLAYFANPEVNYSGMPTGTASQNTALALNNTAPSVANFRQAVTGSCTYALSATSASVGSGTATSSVGVTAGSGCAWSATSNASWLTITSGASGSGNGTTGFSVAANTAGSARSGVMTIAGLSYTVNQAAAACGAFSISPASQSNVAASGASLSVTVTGTTGCAFGATSHASWITVTSASGAGTGTVALSVAANPAGTARTGTVTVAGQTYTVSQLATACNYALSTTTVSVPGAVSSRSVGVTASSGCAWTASSNVAWITITSGTSGSGNGTVSYTVAANTALTTRTGVITIAGRTLTVTQAGAVCTYSLSTTSLVFNRTGGTASLVVTPSASQCTWVIIKNGSWITLSGATSRVGPGTVTVSTPSYSGQTARTGSLSIAGQNVTVTQLGKPRNQALDFNLDGAGDALLYNPSSGSWNKETSAGSSFAASAGDWGPGWNIYPADFNADDRSDLLLYRASTGEFRKLVTQPDGQFASFASQWGPGWGVTILDLDGDRRSDVFLYNKTSGEWRQALTQVSGSDFVYKAGVWAPGWDVKRAVFNTDGRDDLFLYNDQPSSPNAGMWFRVLSGPGGSFSYVASDLRWGSAWTVTAADVSGDGISEVFLYNRQAGNWFVVKFTPTSATYTAGAWVPGLTLHRAEFNNDTKADLFLYNPVTGYYGLAASRGDGTFSLTGGAWAAGWQVSITDLNNNGVSDLLLYHPTLGRWAQVVVASPTSLGYFYGTFGEGWSLFGSHVVLP